MNRIYRLIWNHTLGALVPVAEIVRAKGGGVTRRAGAAGLRLSPLGGALMLALGLSPTLALAQQPLAAIEARGDVSLRAASQLAAVLPSAAAGVVAQSSHLLPTGGQVVSGKVGFTQKSHTLTIDQSSQKAIIDWQSFDIGSGNTVTFHQPGRDSVALNRVLGSDPSAIYGHLQANGQVFLVNPYGVYFAPGAQVDVGGLVASTLNLSDNDFLHGNYQFSGTGSTGVRNDGSIQAATDGYVAFLGRTVDNHGSITTSRGATALGAGSSVSLTLAGQELVSFQVDGAALNALAANGGVIAADGGRVILSAQAKDALLQTVVNNQGRIQAQTVQSHGGTIDLLGGDAGTVQVAGTLDASAPTGDGGAIETSGAHVKVADSAVLTEASAHGDDGSWLIDPQDFTIAASGGDISGATLSANLAKGSVTIKSTKGGTSGAGDLFVNDTVTWSSHTLTLNAYRNIVVNTAMNALNKAALTLQYGQGDKHGVINGVTADYIVNAPINLSSKSKFKAKLGSSGSTVSYTIITTLGKAGSKTKKDLQGITGSLSHHYVLGADIDASTTATWNSGAGFAALGSSKSNFSGVFDGLGHTISGLTINRPTTDVVGLFGVVGKHGVVRNVGLVGGSVAGRSSVGGLVGSNRGTIANAYVTAGVQGAGDSVGGLAGSTTGDSKISNAYAKGGVVGNNKVGGLIGNNLGTLGNAYATGNVRGTGDSVGGLVGSNSAGATAHDVYATGDVNGGNYVGGLMGKNLGGFDNAFASGSVHGTGNSVGGLVGSNATTFRNAYASGNVDGLDNVGGLIGRNSALIEYAYATGNVSGRSVVGGLVGANYGYTQYAYETGHVSGASTVGGLIGLNAANGIVGDGYWDTDTSGQSETFGSDLGATSGDVTGLTTARLASALPAGFTSDVWGNSGNQSTPYLLANASFGVASPVLVGGGTSTVYSLILTLDQLQNIEQAGLSGNYALAADIDATATASWNDGAGFDPIGDGNAAFTGIFDGMGHTITGLTINRPGDGDIGLFGVVGNTGIVRNVGLLGGSVHGGVDVGELVGLNNGTISHVYATGNVIGNITGSSNANIGGLVGQNGGTISDAYATGSVSGREGVGGLVGLNAARGTIANAYATGDVASSASGTGVGGLVGENASAITNAYATGNVSGTSAVGGLVGLNDLNNSIHNVYATGRVSGSSGIGGLIGLNTGNAGTITNGYWDTDTSGQSVGIGGGASASVSGVTTKQFAAALPTGFDASIWANADNQTTPYLVASASSGLAIPVLLGSDTSTTPSVFNLILTLNQLQNIEYTGLAAHYALGANIDASSTASWNGGAGFDPIGDKVTNFTGTFDGLGHTITGLTINRPSTSGVGLFGTVGSGGIVRNIGLVNGSVRGGGYVGGLIGSNLGGAVSNSYNTGAVQGIGIGNVVGSSDIIGDMVGGLIGLNGGAIDGVYASGAVSGHDNVGGLVGGNMGNITNAYATGSVQGRSGIGGLAGEMLVGNLNNVHAMGSVTGTGNWVGGLLGFGAAFGGILINNAYATGAVSGYDDVGGLIGDTSNMIIRNVYASGDVSATATYAGAVVGGLVGYNVSTPISNAYATGNVNGVSTGGYVGGLLGVSVNSFISNVYASGHVSGAGVVRGLVGMGSNGSCVACHWDIDTTGSSVGLGVGIYVGSGTSGLTDVQMHQQSNFSGFDFNSVWTIDEGQSMPRLRALSN